VFRPGGRGKWGGKRDIEGISTLKSLLDTGVFIAHTEGLSGKKCQTKE